MSRQFSLSLILAAAMLPVSAQAQNADVDGLAGSYQLAQNRDYHDVINGLEATNYQVEDVSTTLLGRTRIMASNGVHRREVIVSRSTGEILSDVLMDVPTDPQASARQAAIAAASEPRTDSPGLDIQFGGSLTVGVNSRSGGFGRASLSARQENIGGSNIDATISMSKGFE